MSRYFRCLRFLIFLMFFKCLAIYVHGGYVNLQFFFRFMLEKEKFVYLQR